MKRRNEINDPDKGGKKKRKIETNAPNKGKTKKVDPQNEKLSNETLFGAYPPEAFPNQHPFYQGDGFYPYLTDLSVFDYPSEVYPGQGSFSPVNTNFLDISQYYSPSLNNPLVTDYNLTLFEYPNEFYVPPKEYLREQDFFPPVNTQPIDQNPVNVPEIEDALKSQDVKRINPLQEKIEEWIKEAQGKELNRRMEMLLKSRASIVIKSLEEEIKKWLYAAQDKEELYERLQKILKINPYSVIEPLKPLIIEWLNAAEGEEEKERRMGKIPPMVRKKMELTSVNNQDEYVQNPGNNDQYQEVNDALTNRDRVAMKSLQIERVSQWIEEIPGKRSHERMEKILMYGTSKLLSSFKKEIWEYIQGTRGKKKDELIKKAISRRLTDFLRYGEEEIKQWLMRAKEEKELKERVERIQGTTAKEIICFATTYLNNYLKNRDEDIQINPNSSFTSFDSNNQNHVSSLDDNLKKRNEFTFFGAGYPDGYFQVSPGYNIPNYPPYEYPDQRESIDTNPSSEAFGELAPQFNSLFFSDPTPPLIQDDGDKCLEEEPFYYGVDWSSNA